MYTNIQYIYLKEATYGDNTQETNARMRCEMVLFFVAKWCSQALASVAPYEQNTDAKQTTLYMHTIKHVMNMTINAGKRRVSITGKRSARVSGLRR